MSAHASTRKTKHRYNELEEEAALETKIRRSWARERRRIRRGFRPIWSITWAQYVAGRWWRK